MGRTCYSYGRTESYKKSSRCSGRRKKTEGQAETEMGRWCDGRWQEVGRREIGGMVQGIGTTGRSFWRRLWLKRGCCANDDDDDDRKHFSFYVFPVLTRSLAGTILNSATCSMNFGSFPGDKPTGAWSWLLHKLPRLMMKVALIAILPSPLEYALMAWIGTSSS